MGYLISHHVTLMTYKRIWFLGLEYFFYKIRLIIQFRNLCFKTKFSKIVPYYNSY